MSGFFFKLCFVSLNESFTSSFIQPPKALISPGRFIFPQREQGRVAYDLHLLLKTQAFWVLLVLVTSCDKQLPSNIFLSPLPQALYISYHLN